jgi:2-polyprenyl-6-hydroxyphenyl methylase/3-demethylubiquinone-9 3-methyltransferase
MLHDHRVEAFVTVAPMLTRLVRPDRLTRPRNDPGQYDDLVDRWWDPRGPFALLHWLAAERAAFVPPAERDGALLLDLGCGGGLLAPHLAGRGYRHVGVDLSEPSLRRAREHGVSSVRADVLALPFPDDCADVVVAGEILEHVTDLRRAVREACRVLAPGGTLVIDTVADTPLARFVCITVGERIPGGPPPGLHDARLLVDRAVLVQECGRYGVRLRLRGLRPSLWAGLAWLSGRSTHGRLSPTRSTAVLFQAVGTKDGAGPSRQERV